MTKLVNIKTNADMRELKKLLKDVPEDRQPIAKSLYNELLFMQQTLSVLKQRVADEGPVSDFKQGKQEFLREHPALKAYNTTVQKYSLLYKQLMEIMPESGQDSADELLSFVQGE